METEDHSLLQIGIIAIASMQARKIPLVTIPAERLLLAVGQVERDDLLIVAQFAHAVVSRDTRVDQRSYLDERVVEAEGIDFSRSSITSIVAEDIEKNPPYVVAEGCEDEFDLFGGVMVFRTRDNVYVAYYVCTRDALPKVRERWAC